MTAEEYILLSIEKMDEFSNEIRSKRCSQCELKGKCEPMVGATYGCNAAIFFEIMERFQEWRKPFWNDKLKEEVENLMKRC